MRTAMRRTTVAVVSAAFAAVCWGGMSTAHATPVTGTDVSASASAELPGVEGSVGVEIAPGQIQVDGQGHIVGTLEAEYP